MAVLIGLSVVIALLIYSVLNSIYLGFPLLFAYIYFLCLSLKRGRSWAAIARSSWNGAKKSFVVILILLLVSCLNAAWMSAGTVASFVYYCFSLVSPAFFLLIAFCATCVISLLFGSCVATTGTIGVILMAIARGGGIDPYMTAGVIISAAYVGDRCSPMSPTMYLLSTVTETDAYRNVPMAMATTVGPLITVILLYVPLSSRNPLITGDIDLRQSIGQSFYIGLSPFLPALIIVALCLFRVDIKLSMLISTVCAIIVAIWAQGMSLGDMLSALIWGYTPAAGSSLAGIIQGGGLINMLRTCFIMLTACALSGVLIGIDAMRGLDKLLAKTCSRFQLYLKTAAVGALILCCGCNLTISIVTSEQLLRKPYKLNGLNPYDLARDISCTVLPMGALVPWCTASMVPTVTLGVPLANHWPYLFYPLLLPLWYGVHNAAKELRRKKEAGYGISDSGEI